VRRGISAVLFDLDGTLIDSAPDLAAAANDLLIAHGRESLPFVQLRPHSGSGARGMLGAAFGLKPGEPDYESMRDAFYELYEVRMLQSTEMFPQVQVMLSALESAGLPWGIVTNKAMRFAGPSVHALGLATRSKALVAGDTTPHTKPHPAPLLEAARRMGHAPHACVYVGDDPRDMQAGRAAGMQTLAAAWGYLGPDLGVHEWSADCVLNHPSQLLQWLEVA